MSIALTQKVKEMEAKLKELLQRIEAIEKASDHEDVIRDDPPKRRGRPPKNENV